MTPEAIRAAAYVIGEEIRRRRVAALPLPPWLLGLDRTMRDELAALGHRATPGPAETAGLMSTEQVANRVGLSTRSVRRNAARLGGYQVAGRWVFPDQ